MPCPLRGAVRREGLELVPCPLREVVQHGEHSLCAELTQVRGTVVGAGGVLVIMLEHGHNFCINLNSLYG